MSTEVNREETFVAVRVVTTVRLPITLPDSDWMPYAEQLVSEIRGAIDAVKDDRRHRAPEMTDDVRFANVEIWEVTP